jgi:hypothetical protein
MPVRRILLSAVTASVGVVAPAASIPAEERFTVSATVVSPCSISVRGAAPSPTEVKTVSVDCALPGQSFVREDDRPAPPPIRSATEHHRAPEMTGTDTTEIIEVVF